MNPPSKQKRKRNTKFIFKRFVINQDKCAMKVCTESIILGSYVSVPPKTENILDIGTGTGVLALMLAQKSSEFVKIDAVEIEKDAFEQASDNFLQSEWRDRIMGYHSSIQDFSSKIGKKYQLIVSNPPFFQSEFPKSEVNEKRNIARHTISLTQEELIEVIKKLMDKNGIFCVLLPFLQFQKFERLAEKENIFCNKILQIRHSKDHPLSKIVGIFEFTKKEKVVEELIIFEAPKIYSKQFIELTKDYYLSLKA